MFQGGLCRKGQGCSVPMLPKALKQYIVTSAKKPKEGVCGEDPAQRVFLSRITQTISVDAHIHIFIPQNPKKYADIWDNSNQSAFSLIKFTESGNTMVKRPWLAHKWTYLHGGLRRKYSGCILDCPSLVFSRAQEWALQLCASECS